MCSQVTYSRRWLMLMSDWGRRCLGTSGHGVWSDIEFQAKVVECQRQRCGGTHYGHAGGIEREQPVWYLTDGVHAGGGTVRCGVPAVRVVKLGTWNRSGLRLLAVAGPDVVFTSAVFTPQGHGYPLTEQSSGDRSVLRFPLPSLRSSGWPSTHQKGACHGISRQQQSVPGIQAQMDPVPDCGENSYTGSGKLTGKCAVITGGDSGIGRAVAIAFAREGADVLIAYLNEDEDAQDVARYVEDAGRKCVLVRGDLSGPEHCRAVIERAASEFGRIDVLVNNAAYQMMHENLEEITDEEWDYTFKLNVGAHFYLTKAALPHMSAGSSIIGSSSVNSDSPNPTLAPYAATKAAIGISPPVLLRCSARAVSESTVWHRVRYGRR